MYNTAQLPLYISLSLSIVLNAMLLCRANESPAVPEYEPTSSRYFACSSPILNVTYLANALAPFQSSNSTRKELGLAADSLWILSFPITRTQQSVDQSLICNRSIPDRSPPSHLVFSGTRSTLHHQCACHSIHWRILYRLGPQNTLHSEYGLILTAINNLDLKVWIHVL